ncbi:MAG: hypothetical protein QM796_14285 [Chthoniobacteraceae bacterium]
MALHINLYHEIQKQERQRSRDPLRLGLMGIVGVILLCIAYYFYRQHQVSVVSDQDAQLQADWAKLQPQQERAAQQQDKLSQDLKLHDSFTQRIEGRFYWGPVMQSIIEIVPRDVQITHMTASSGPVADSPHHTGSIQFSGIAAGAQPRTTAENFRNALRDKFARNFSGVTSTFKSLDDSSESVAVNGQTLPTVSFSIELDFNDAPATPAPAK